MSKPFEKNDANERKQGISHKNSGIPDLNLFIKMRKHEAEQNKTLQGKKNQQERISDMARNALTKNQPETERKEALDALHLNDGFFQEKSITIQQALKEHSNALKSLKETDSHLESSKSLEELYKQDMSSLKNATPEQIDKMYSDINQSLESLDAIKAKLDIFDYAKKYMSKAQEIEGIDKMTPKQFEGYIADLKAADDIAEKLNESKDTVIKKLENMKQKIAPHKFDLLEKEMTIMFDNYKNRENTPGDLQRVKSELTKINHDYAKLNSTLRPTIEDLKIVADQISSSSTDNSTWQDRIKNKGWADMVDYVSDQLNMQRKDYQEHAKSIDKKQGSQTELDSLQLLRERADNFVKKAKPQVEDVLKRQFDIAEGLHDLEDHVNSDFAPIREEMEQKSQTYRQDRKNRWEAIKQLDREVKDMRSKFREGKVSQADIKTFIENRQNKIEGQITHIDHPYAEINGTLKPILDHVSTVTHPGVNLGWRQGDGLYQVDLWQSDVESWSFKLDKHRDDYQRLTDNLSDLAKHAGLESSLGSRTNLKETNAPKETLDTNKWTDNINKIRNNRIEREISFPAIQQKVEKLKSEYDVHVKNESLPTLENLKKDYIDIEETIREVKGTLANIRDDYAEINLNLRQMIDHIETQDQANLKQSTDQNSDNLSKQREKYADISKELEYRLKDTKDLAKKLESKITDDRYNYTLSVNQWINRIEDGLQYATQDSLDNTLTSTQEVKNDLKSYIEDIDRDALNGSINPDMTDEWSKNLNQQKRHYLKMQTKVENFEKQVEKQLGKVQRFNERASNLKEVNQSIDDIKNDWENVKQWYRSEELHKLITSARQDFSKKIASIETDIADTNDDIWRDRLNQQKQSHLDFDGYLEQVGINLGQEIQQEQIQRLIKPDNAWRNEIDVR